MATSFFISGTDTGVGKTWVTARWVAALRAKGVNAVGMKPIACGDREDAEALLAASGSGVTMAEVNPVWLRPAVAPYPASMIEERVVDLDLVREAFRALTARHDSILVEGAGGWLVPIRRDYSMADLAAELALPVVVVAANRLGVLNHALLTVDGILSRGLRCAGVVLNQTTQTDDFDAAQVTNPGILEELLAERSVPLLGEITHGSPTLPERLLQLA